MFSLQEVEEEEPVERYSDEEAPPGPGEPNPPAVTSPAEEEEVKEEDAQSKEESKCEEKGTLAGERQSGDGQVSLDAHVRPRQPAA